MLGQAPNKGMPMRTFEDFPAGLAQTLGPLTVSKDDIVAFAREYDAQPFHVDEIAARDSFIGTLIASGWHSCSLNMRLVADGLLLDSSAMGAPGIEEVKWVKPVRPGDTLRSHMTVLDSRISKSRPSLGLVRFHFDMVNQADEKVLSQTNWVMFATRDAEPVLGRGQQRSQRRREVASRSRVRAGNPAGLRQSLFRGSRHRRDGGAGLPHLHAGRHRRLRQAVRPAALPCGCGGRQEQPVRRRSAPRAGIRRASG